MPLHFASLIKEPLPAELFFQYFSFHCYSVCGCVCVVVCVGVRVTYTSPGESKYLLNQRMVVLGDRCIYLYF